MPRKYWVPLLASLALFALNAYICRELFSIDFMRNLDSNEGVFVAISRFFRESFRDQRWFPLFNAGMPIENAYQPLLPLTAALTGWLTGWSVERAFHFVLAITYCLGPATLFWFAWDWSRSLLLSVTAGIAYSLTSFAELLIPILRVRTDGHWAPLRLHNLVHYAEDPHNVALTLLPLALLFLRRAIVRRTAENVIAAVVFCGSVVLSNGFGAADLAIGGLCIVLALGGGLPALMMIGLITYLWISPWLPPSLIALVRKDQWASGAYFSGTWKMYGVAALTLAVSGLIWWFARRLKPLERFSLLFVPWMCMFPMGYFLLGITLLPQSNRYQLEMEMALCLALACALARLFAPGTRPVLRVALALMLVVAGARQTKIFRHYARGLIQPVDIAQTIEYKTARWFDQNLPGQRVMASGDVQFLFNVLSNNPQLGGGHEPQVPNWMNRVAVYTIYSGTGAGEKDGEVSLFWLKAFGVQAINVPGEKSREHYHPFAHPHKFDGLLPVLWHEEDDTIYGVPHRSKSLAHVIPGAAVVTRQPIHGLDLDPAGAYVAALDDPALPLAEMTWSGNACFRVRAPMKRGDVLSVQVSYMPGWQASVNGRSIPVGADGLGLLVLKPECEGNCEVQVSYGVTTEAWICRGLSGFVTLGLVALAVLRRQNSPVRDAAMASNSSS